MRSGPRAGDGRAARGDRNRTIVRFRASRCFQINNFHDCPDNLSGFAITLASLTDTRECRHRRLREPPRDAGSPPPGTPVRRSASRSADPPAQSAGHTERRETQRIDSAYQPRRGQPDIFILPSEPDGGIADSRGRGRRRRGDQAIHVRPERRELAPHPAPQPLRVDVVGRRDQAALVEQRQDVRAELLPVARGSGSSTAAASASRTTRATAFSAGDVGHA